MSTQTSAIITDTWHNTSQSINITPQICKGTDSHSLSLSLSQKIIIHLPLYICLSVYLFIPPTHISSNLIPEARASFPGERVNVTELPLQTPQCCCLCCCRCCCCYCCFPFLPARYSTEIFKKINPGRHVSAPLLPTAPSMEQPVV